MSSFNVRDKLLEVAGPVFSEKGFEKATVREICQKADVNLASVNYYFGDKEQLYLEVIRLAKEMGISRAPLPEWSSDTSPEQKLRDWVTTLVMRMLGTDSWSNHLIMREVLEPTKACEHLIQEHFRPFVNIADSILQEMLGEEVPEYRRMQCVFSIAAQCQFYRVSESLVTLMLGNEEKTAHYDVECLIEHVLQFSLAAIKNLKQEMALSEMESSSTVHKI
ncbi:TetR/AcrR family transcriptional regulator [Gimesia aquarii]|uniref:Putative HTH-type transcriptional regulator YttP n=1 Tax=Gimesia aquarii TaxID=2527964 RepID=A0A517WWA6_9PLAN|nr:CerR family C-terminal domain-containing protein [Gimesia aquarii]QDU09547.1 putative HTH-type transcriptional regulator YttP [Gimesia aquarii]